MPRSPLSRPFVPGAALAAVLAATLSAAGAHAVAAQTVTGVVHDSLAGRPLADATVQLVPALERTAAPRTARTDSLGHFRLDDVPPGRYIVGFLHDRLRALRLDPPSEAIEVRQGAAPRVALAIPGARAIATLACGTQRDSAGALVGRVLAADGATPAPGGAVTVQWLMLVVDRAGVRQEERAVRAVAEEDGRFVACGVPTGDAVAVQATASAGRSGVVELQLPPSGALERDLLVAGGRAEAPARLTGQVRTPEGAPVPNARVVVHGTSAHDTTTTSDARGAYVLGALPGGTFTLEARAIGFVPGRVAVDLVRGSATEAAIVLGASIARLDSIRVVAQAARLDMTGFSDRRRLGFGRFYDASDIERYHPMRASDVFLRVPGVRVAPTPEGATLYTRGWLNLGAQCEPDVYVDGMRIPDGAKQIDALIPPASLGGVEVYVDPATVPPQYLAGSCGAVVLWTKRGR